MCAPTNFLAKVGLWSMDMPGKDMSTTMSKRDPQLLKVVSKLLRYTVKGSND